MKRLRVLVACEFSGVVRDAFIAAGHDAWSCDLLPTEVDGPHIRGNALRLAYRRGWWDLMVAHPPCTYLARAGARWWPGREREQREALAFVQALLDAPIPRIALENPAGRIGTAIRPADQYVQPWQFGVEQSKMTGLWLKNLPKLVPTNVVGRGSMDVFRSGRRMPSWYDLPPGPRRGLERSRTCPGIAQAMAQQWGCAEPERRSA